MSEFNKVHNPLFAVPGKVLLEELKMASVTVMTDPQLAAGTAVLDLMPPDLFDASEVSDTLRVCSAEGAYGGDVTFRVGPQDEDPEAKRPYVSIKTTDRGVIVRGSGAGVLRVDSLSAVTTGQGTVNVSHINAARNIRLFPDLPSQVHIDRSVSAAGAIIKRTIIPPQMPPN